MKSLSRVQLSMTPWTAAYQAPPSMGFSRQEYLGELPLPSPWEVETRPIITSLHPSFLISEGGDDNSPLLFTLLLLVG